MVIPNQTYYSQYLLSAISNAMYCLKENEIFNNSYKKTYTNHLVTHRKRNNSKLITVVMTYAVDMQSRYFACKFYLVISMGKNGNNV